VEDRVIWVNIEKKGAGDKREEEEKRATQVLIPWKK